MSKSDKTLQEIKDELKEIKAVQKDIDKTLVKQEAQLSEHIRRTQILEEKLEPVEKHVAAVNGVLRFLGVISVVVGIIAGLIKIFS